MSNLTFEQQLQLERIRREVEAVRDLNQLRQHIVELAKTNFEMQNNYKQLIKKEWGLDA